MEKEFVPFELAVKLKELGFDFPAFAFSTTGEKIIFVNSSLSDKGSYLSYRFAREFGIGSIVTLPLWQQAFEGFFTEKGLYSYISRFSRNEFDFYIENRVSAWSADDFLKTHEEARQACLEKLIELTK